jgi:hypothetical protein
VQRKTKCFAGFDGFVSRENQEFLWITLFHVKHGCRKTGQ